MKSTVILYYLESLFLIGYVRQNKPLAAIMHLFGWLWSLGVTCFTGQKIIDMTESIPVNMWNSNWYIADIKIRKDVQFAMLSAQRSFTLTALPLGTLDMPLLLLLLKSSYSYLTLVTNST
ncbi:odorant receptor 85c-like [Diabrotica undecimpunctata]|uniref:odorant receptor 85c-like n=1 Tax=Diabrotica undecimpunctata TaxID=50387 RepID=UPI003B63BCC7